jgi:sucrose-6-phosphate hydrolase SacC (GH32 family)
LEGDSPIIQVAWTRYPYTPRLSWQSQTSFPVELTLWNFPEGLRVCRKPIDELDNLRIGEQRWRDITVDAGEKPMSEIAPGLLDLHIEMEPAGASTFGLNVAGHEIRYSISEQKLRVDEFTAPLPLPNKRLKLRIVVDRPSIDVFADRGQVTVAAVKLEPHTGPPVTFVSEGGELRVTSLQANRLESIWSGRP